MASTGMFIQLDGPISMMSTPSLLGRAPTPPAPSSLVTYEAPLRGWINAAKRSHQQLPGRCCRELAWHGLHQGSMQHVGNADDPRCGHSPLLAHISGCHWKLIA